MLRRRNLKRIEGRLNVAILVEKRLLSTNKDFTKFTDFEISKNKEKKPRVPKTRRPRLKVEKKETATLTFLKEKSYPYDPCTIEIFRKDYTHLDDCKINSTLKDYNMFITLTLKNKSETYDIPSIKYLSKRLSLSIPQKFFQDTVSQNFDL